MQRRLCRGSSFCTYQVLPACAGYELDRWLSYWVSFDPDTCTLKYGVGHHMEETTMMTYGLPADMGGLFRTTPKLVTLQGYIAGPVERRSIFEAKLSTLDGHEVRCERAGGIHIALMSALCMHL